MAGIARWGSRHWGVHGVALGLGALWWWAVVRVVAVPEAGALEAAVAAGGWGLSVLPVHCVPKRRARGVVGAGRWRRVLQAGVGARAGGGHAPRAKSGGG
ncbi:hypothetical protein A4E84_29410 [Streptomyces qaidamensis]|uniref:Uncharacterized protein n=1 Tax=Streptomyces qaidamensis TaxID=1783515 RepID=A0A143CDR0_9ACTN|nr:hypothetical protein [Streptomyces qaidamensis]AMW15548.1 hypothetical protein A4E84_29410 [Streptomyces qaidamensis]